MPMAKDQYEKETGGLGMSEKTRFKQTEISSQTKVQKSKKKGFETVVMTRKDWIICLICFYCSSICRRQS